MQALARAFVMSVTVAAGAQLVGCGGSSVVTLENQELEAGCGMCRYGQPAGKGCYWVVSYQGKAYPVAGKLPQDHDNHAPDGMCNMKRRVTVSGEIRGENFVASRFEVLPADGVPENPEYTDEDVH